jgi:fibro-slime domain-containing protein
MRSLSGFNYLGLLGFALISFDAYAQAPDSLPIPVKLRDFKEYVGNGAASQPTLGANSHPDFQHVNPCADEGYVMSDIGTDGSIDTTQSLFLLDNRNPVKSPKMATGNPPATFKRVDNGGNYTAGNNVPCFTSAARFDQWYNDHTGAPGSVEDVNRPFLMNIVLKKGTDGLYRYDNSSFFPLDDNNVANLTPAVPGVTTTFGQEQPSPNQIHNYGFTMEFHATFSYQSDVPQTFTFRGDDDVWVFINGKLVIDLGGRHVALEKSVDLKTLGLTDGDSYILDFFLAERHTSASNCLITTSLQLTAEQEPSLVFTDEAGTVLQPNQYWSPKDKLFLVYKDDYRKGLHKDVTISVKNNNGKSAPDNEVLDMGEPTQDKALGTWRVQVPLGESTAPTKNGTVETYILGELNASVKSHSFKGLPDGNEVNALLRVAYPDKPATMTLKSDTGTVDRYTKDLTLTLNEQSFSKFTDTVYLSVRCNQSGDTLQTVQVIEISDGVYQGTIKKDEASGPTGGDKILECKISDQVAPKYKDQVYGTQAPDIQVSWTSTGATVFKYTTTKGDATTGVARVKDGVNNTFYIYIKLTDPDIHKKDVRTVTLTTSNPTSDNETITVTETDTSSGIFVSDAIPYVFGNGSPIPNNKKIEAKLDPTGKTNTVTVTGLMVEDNNLKATLDLESSFNQVVKAYIKDENGDGQGDHVYIVFTQALAVPPDSLTTHWNENNSPKPGDPVLTLKDGDNHVVVADYSAHQFPLGLTGIPKGATPHVDLPGGSIYGGQKPPVADSMGPVITAATIYPFNPTTLKSNSSNVGEDTIKVTVSEEMRSQSNFTVALHFAKVKPGEACPSYDKARQLQGIVQEPKVSDDGLTYTFIVPLSSETPVTGDCLYITADGTYSDLLLNWAPKHGTKMDGDKPPKQVAIQGYPAVVGCEPTDPCFGISNNDPGDGNRYVKPNGNGEGVRVFLPPGYVYDPNKQYTEPVFPSPDDSSRGTDNSDGVELPKNISTVQVVSTGRYRCNITLFDHIGNFVNSWQQTFGFHGELYNNNRIVPGGMVSYLVWNLKDKKGRHAGQGVYVWKMVFLFDNNKQEIRYTRTGVLRTKALAATP